MCSMSCNCIDLLISSFPYRGESSFEELNLLFVRPTPKHTSFRGSNPAAAAFRLRVAIFSNKPTDNQTPG